MISAQPNTLNFFVVSAIRSGSLVIIGLNSGWKERTGVIHEDVSMAFCMPFISQWDFFSAAHFICLYGSTAQSEIHSCLAKIDLDLFDTEPL